MNEQVELSLAATNLRIALEDVMKRTGALLGGTIDGVPVQGCPHVADNSRLYLDAHGSYICCAACAGVRMAETGPELRCGVCSLSDRASGWSLDPWAPGVALGAPVLVDTGAEVLTWYGDLMLFPVAATCRAHDGAFDSHATFVWSPKGVHDAN